MTDLPRLPDDFQGVCKIEKTYSRETRFGECFVCEMTTADGQRAVWTQRLTHLSAPALQQWAAAVLDVGPAEFRTGPGGLHLEWMIAEATRSPEDNRFTQRYVTVRVSLVNTKNGRLFPLHRFFPHRGGPPPQTVRVEAKPQPTRKVRLQ